MPRLPMPVKTYTLVAKGFALMHESCPKPVEPSKQVQLFDELAAKEPENPNGNGRPGHAIDTWQGDIHPTPAWALFDRRWPLAHDAAALHGDLATAMQGIGTPSVEEIRKHPPESATFQEMAHWSRLKIAHMNHEEYPDLWLPDLVAMPKVLAQRVKPKRKASVRPPITSKSWKAKSTTRPHVGRSPRSIPSR